MKILGIGGSSHDFSATVVVDGKIKVAIEDERLTRKKYGLGKWHSNPNNKAIDYCLNYNNYDLDDIDLIIANDDYEPKRSLANYGEIQLVNHHILHAASSFYPSPFENSALLVVDGHGSIISSNCNEHVLETISIGKGTTNKIGLDTFQSGKKVISSGSWKYLTENSLGTFYKVISEVIGFGFFGSGKTMGLSSYGDLSLLGELKTFASFTKDGNFFFDPLNGIYDWLTDKLKNERNSFQIRANITKATQTIFEDTIVAIANTCYKKTKLPYLCYSGGCALNSITNYKLKYETPFEKVFIFPASGDNGLSIGAATYGYYHLLKNKRIDPAMNNSNFIGYLGKEYTNNEIKEALSLFSVCYWKPENLTTEIIQRLSEKQTIALFQGRSEIGPRALGNRSIIADPSSLALRDHINLNLKNRESFRPLAPVVPENVAEKYFDINFNSPYMLNIAPVREQFKNKLAGVTHIDGTARIQTVTKNSNPFLFKLLNKYAEETGIPILINTSFNSCNEPIVESPSDAITCFLNMDIDTLVLGDFIVEKHTPWAKHSKQK